MKRLIITTCLLVSSILANAQPLNQRLQSAMEKKRANNSLDVARMFKNDAKKSGEDLVNLLAIYASDSSEYIRYYTCDMYMLIANYGKGRDVNLTVEALSKMLSDSSTMVSNNAAQLLSQVKLTYFTDKAKENAISGLSVALRNPKNITEAQLKLCGYLQLKSFIPQLQTIGDDRKNSKMLRWAAYLAMARMGDEIAVSEVLHQVKRAGMNDDVVYSLLPGLVYTKQKVIFDYLVEQLNSDEKNCTSSNPDSDMEMVCGYRIMEMLAPEIKKFPLKALPSGDIDTKDYPQALETARKWFASHPDYEILTEQF